MLTGIDPILTGGLLAHLDEMGHSDGVVIADAHFPAHRLAGRHLMFPGLSAPQVLTAVRTVLPLDDSPSLDLMASADGRRLDVQDELIAAAGSSDDNVRWLARQAFYDAAAAAYLIIRTGEARPYGNVIVRKGLVVDHPGAV